MPRPYDIRERTFVFACEVVRFTLKLAERSDLRRIAFQLMDSATSIAANVEEAKSGVLQTRIRDEKLHRFEGSEGSSTVAQNSQSMLLSILFMKRLVRLWAF